MKKGIPSLLALHPHSAFPRSHLQRAVIKRARQFQPVVRSSHGRLWRSVKGPSKASIGAGPITRTRRGAEPHPFLLCRVANFELTMHSSDEPEDGVPCGKLRTIRERCSAYEFKMGGLKDVLYECRYGFRVHSSNAQTCYYSTLYINHTSIHLVLS